jgi:hypothetical protein
MVVVSSKYGYEGYTANIMSIGYAVSWILSLGEMKSVSNFTSHDLAYEIEFLNVH